MGIKISAFIITKNEERKIEDALKSLNFADEIVIVDDFSEDATVEICKKYGAKIFIHRFTGFKDQKNYAMCQTKNDWVFELDADERLSKNLQEYMKNLSEETLSGYDGVLFRRKTYFWGKWLKHGGTYPDYKMRLYRKDRGVWSDGNIHERFIIKGRALKTTFEILHYQDADLKSLFHRTIRYSLLSAEDMYKKGKKAKWHHYTFRPAYTFFYKYFFRLGFLDGIQGFVSAVIAAIGTFAKYMFLKEKERAKSSS